MGTYFGTDGVRGKMGTFPLKENFLVRLGEALGRWAVDGGNGAPRFALGRDTRASGEVVRDWILYGMARAGISTVYDLGILPTPVIAFGGDRLGARLSLAITASHNPASDNGVKLFLPGCRKVAPQFEAELEAMIDRLSGATFPGKPGIQTLPNPGASQAYFEHLTTMYEGRLPKGVRCVVDTANGATSVTTPRVLRALGVTVLQEGEAREDTVINDGVGSEHPAVVAERVSAANADCGIAHDGDGDRIVVVDGTGKVIDGDQLLGFLAIRLKERNALPKDTLVTTVQSNSGLDASLRERGIAVVRTEVGDRNVQERIISGGYGLGGENSGHLIIRESLATGDGLGAACLLMSLCTKDELRKLHEVVAEVKLYPQVTATMRVKEKPPLPECRRLSGAIAEAEAALGEAGRVLVRYSGTEPKLRFLAEAATKKKAREVLASLEAAAKADLS